MKTNKAYDTSEMTDEEIAAFKKKVLTERWLWTCNGLVMRPTEDEFDFRFKRKSNYGDVISFLVKDRRSFRNDIPVMG